MSNIKNARGWARNVKSVFYSFEFYLYALKLSRNPDLIKWATKNYELNK